ncbi:tyrosine-type recombinase/integrase [Aquisalimonas asiatica]|uniref:Phage integrase family protein n=1 Tax=Aquisalimonas asiatica TaxID=406100 RepID=A0A1H8S3B3_9GAMM|nr:tyrosine-type recombinase/integrase [Aquisalimonas asiatica]SEO73145.1 Phage integrase family protein [Aquisalimonas asiatica]
MGTIIKRKGPDGRAVYQIQIRVKNPHDSKRYNHTQTFDTRREAKVWLRDHEGEIRRQLKANPQDAGAFTLADACRRYITDICPTLKGGESDTGRLERWIRRHPMRNVPLAELHRGQLSDWRDDRLDVVKPSTVKKELGLFSRVIEAAIQDWGYDLRENPVKRIRKPKSNDARDRRLRGPEEAYLLQAALPERQPGYHNHPARNTSMEAILILAIETGMRRSEITRLEWRHVFEDEGYALLKDTKNGHDREILLTRRASETLARLRDASAGEHVSPYSVEAIRNAWRRILIRARNAYHADCKAQDQTPDPALFANLTFHDLRHEQAGCHPRQSVALPALATRYCACHRRWSHSTGYLTLCASPTVLVGFPTPEIPKRLWYSQCRSSPMARALRSRL